MCEYLRGVFYVGQTKGCMRLSVGLTLIVACFGVHISLSHEPSLSSALRCESDNMSESEGQTAELQCLLYPPRLRSEEGTEASHMMSARRSQLH